jgi:urease accessory protein
VLVAEDGSLVKVIAAPQPVLVVTHCAQHGSAFDLMRAAYHLGNRHVPIELTPTHLKIEPDHVLADMLRAMHLIVREAEEPFEPENGAYGAHGAGGHGHHSHDGDSHGDHGHSHAPARGRTPVGPVLHADAYGGGSHDHGHGHDDRDQAQGGHDHAQCSHDHSH